MAIYINNPAHGATIDKFKRKGVNYVHPVGEIREYDDHEIAREIIETYPYLEDVTQQELEKAELEKKRIAEAERLAEQQRLEEERKATESTDEQSGTTPDQPSGDSEKQPDDEAKSRRVQRKRSTRRRRRG